MTKQTRTILFFICVFLFLLLSPAIILYSQGYRFDWRNRGLTKTGAIYIKATPKGADIFIDGRLKKKTDFLFGSLLVENLLPKSYFVEVKKKGFSSWKKNLQVKASQVTEAKNILLFSQELPDLFQLAAKGIDEVSLSPSGKQIILKKSDNQGWYLTVFYPQENFEEVVLKEREVEKKEKVQLIDINWSPDSNKIILNTAIKENQRFFLLDLTKKPFLAVSLDSLIGAFEEVRFQEDNQEKLLVLKNSRLSVFDISSKESNQVADNVIAFESSGPGVYFLEKQGGLFWIENTSSNEKQEKVIADSLPLKQETAYQIRVLKGEIFLLEDATLFVFKQEKKTLEKISEGVEDVKISKNGRILAYLKNDGEIWVVFLKEQLEQPAKTETEKVFLARFFEKLGNLFWLNSHYLIFSVGDKIKIIEIDIRDVLNNFEVGKFSSPHSQRGDAQGTAHFFFNEDSKKVLLFSEGKLLISEPLIPY